MTSKVSVSLSDDDISFLDQYAGRAQETRSGVIHAAIKALRREQLVEEYAQAFAEFEDTGEAALWDSTSGDGIGR
jgi:predicted transcriptional regulator